MDLSENLLEALVLPDLPVEFLFECADAVMSIAQQLSGLLERVLEQTSVEALTDCFAADVHCLRWFLTVSCSRDLG